MTRLPLTPSQRDRLATVGLVALLIIACPLIGSLLARRHDACRKHRYSHPASPFGRGDSSGDLNAQPNRDRDAHRHGGTQFNPDPRPIPRPNCDGNAVSAVYLAPFRQVLMEGQTLPVPSAPALYENASEVFLMVDRQGTYVRLQTVDGKQAFWTGKDNISADPPAAPEYDFGVRGRTVRFAGVTGTACQHQSNLTLPIDPCQSLANFTGAVLTARITSGNVVVYLADINGQTYFLLPEAGAFS